MIRVFLAGEGANELGRWALEERYRGEAAIGCLEALLRAVTTSDWEVGGAVLWRRIRKYRAGEHRRPETRNVIGAALAANELGCRVLAFARDRDGSKERQRDVEEGRAKADGIGPRIIGGVAIESLDAWVLAIRGEARTEKLDRPKELVRDRGIETTADMVGLIESNGVSRVPDDATSLLDWVAQARSVLPG